MKWHISIWGEWYCNTLDKIMELPSAQHHPFLLAEGANDEDLIVLQQYPQVRGLAILSLTLTTAAIRTLGSLPDLRELILCGPPITDDFLLSLKSLAAIEVITLVHTSCTSDGVRSFLEAVPKCKIYRGGADSIYPSSVRRELQLFLPEPT
jgi:hypothetical protein